MMTGRLFVYGVPVAGAARAWTAWHQPGHFPGLALLLLAGVAAWPVLAVGVAFVIPALIQEAWPRDWRKWWRRGHWWRHGAKATRPHVPAWLRRAVLAADRYRCVVCGETARLELDHIVPWSLGGLATFWNLATLCHYCNMIRSNYWEYRSGTVVYQPWAGYADEYGARDILYSELRARRNPVRWWLAARGLI